MKIILPVVLVFFCSLGFAQQTVEKPAIGDVSAAAKENGVEVTVAVDNDALPEALKQKVIPIIVTVKNNGLNVLGICEYDPRNSGITVYVLDKSGKPKPIFPDPSKTFDWTSGVGTIDINAHESHLIKALIPLNILKSRDDRFVVGVIKQATLQGDGHEVSFKAGEEYKSTIFFSQPFSLPPLPDLK